MFCTGANCKDEILKRKNYKEGSAFICPKCSVDLWIPIDHPTLLKEDLEEEIRRKKGVSHEPEPRK